MCCTVSVGRAFTHAGFLGQSVRDLNPDAVIDHFDDLVPALARLGQPNHRSTA